MCNKSLSFILLLIISVTSVLMLACKSDQSANAQSSNYNPRTQSNELTSSADATRDPVMGSAADIKISAIGAPAGSAFLIGILGDQRFRMDSTTVSAQGQLSFNEPNGYPQGHYFVYFSNNRNFQVLLGEDQSFTIDVEMADVLNTMKVSGSIDNELLYDNMRFEESLRPQFAAIAEELKTVQEGTSAYDELKAKQTALVDQRKSHLNQTFSDHPGSLYTSFKKSGQNPDPRMDLDEDARLAVYRKDFWANVDFGDARLLRTPVIFNKLKRYMDELTQQHPDSVTNSAIWLIDRAEPYPDFFKFFANWVPLTYEPTKTTLMDPEMVLTRIIQRYFTHDKAFWVDSVSIYGFQQRATEMAGSLIGNQAPNVTSTDPEGNPQTLLDKKAEYLIVYMYNPECEHCMEQTPKLVDFYNQHSRKDIDVYAIAIDTDDTKWKNYIKKNNMTWTNVHDPSNRSIYGKYYVDHTPELYVLNPDRIIIGKNLKVNQVMTVVNRDKEKRG